MQNRPMETTTLVEDNIVLAAGLKIDQLQETNNVALPH